MIPQYKISSFTVSMTFTYPMIAGTRIGTRILRITPDTKEYTAISLRVDFSTIGRHTSIAAAPGMPVVSIYPTFFATAGISTAFIPLIDGYVGDVWHYVFLLCAACAATGIVASFTPASNRR